MAALGGSVVIATIGGRPFPVAADADVQLKLGGWQNEREMNGNGTQRTIKTREGWMASGLVVEIDDGRGDLEYLQNIANNAPDDGVAIALELVSGTVYQGKGQILNDLQMNTRSATASLDLGGAGTLTQQ